MEYVKSFVKDVHDCTSLWRGFFISKDLHELFGITIETCLLRAKRRSTLIIKNSGLPRLYRGQLHCEDEVHILLLTNPSVDGLAIKKW